MGDEHGAPQSDAYDNPENRGAGRIPSPRPAPDNHIESLPKIGPGSSEWWYDQRDKRGKTRRYIGYVTRVGGAEGEKLRADLAAVIRDLLIWAKQEQADNPSREDGAADDLPS